MLQARFRLECRLRRPRNDDNNVKKNSCGLGFLQRFASKDQFSFPQKANKKPTCAESYVPQNIIEK